MREQRPQTQTISDVKNRLSSLVNEVYQHETRVLVEKSGIPVAAIVSAEDLMRLSQLEQDREALFAAIDRMREAFKDVPPEEIEREADRAVAELRGKLVTTA
jgi:prevent-host-death family protein